MSNETIEVVEIIETDFGEKIVIDSPYQTRHYIKFLPWKEYGEEMKEYDSLREKAKDRGTDVDSIDDQVFDCFDSFDFSDDFSTHVSWNPNALAGDGGWTIDREAFPEAREFWHYCGFDVHVPKDQDKMP